MKQSAGILLYRTTPHGLEVLLIHASGNYNRHKPWSIPKGEPDPGEDDLEATARREVLEETGMTAGPLTALGTIKYSKSGKTIHAFAGQAAAEEAPRCASWEIDQARFMPLEEARKLLHPEQAPFLDRLCELLRISG